ncbi:hypothetical protein Q7P37_004023 [Cladosporium fusiforme]
MWTKPKQAASLESDKRKLKGTARKSTGRSNTSRAKYRTIQAARLDDIDSSDEGPGTQTARKSTGGSNAPRIRYRAIQTARSSSVGTDYETLNHRTDQLGKSVYANASNNANVVDAPRVLLPWKDPRYRDFHSDPVPRIDINTAGNALYEIDDEFDENLWQATVTELRRLDNLSEDPNLPKWLDILEGYSTLAQCTNFVFQIQDWETIAREVARIQLCWKFRNACLLYAIKRALPRSVAQRLSYTPDQHAYLLWEDFLTYRLKLNHPLHLSLAEQEKHEELLKLDKQNKRIGRDWEPNENDHCCNP